MPMPIDSKKLEDIIKFANQTKQIQSEIDNLQKKIVTAKMNIAQNFDNEILKAKFQTQQNEFAAAIDIARIELDAEKKKFATALSSACDGLDANHIYDNAIKSTNFDKALISELEKTFVVPRRIAYRSQLKTAATIVMLAALFLGPIALGIGFGVFGLGVMVGVVGTLLGMMIFASVEDSKKEAAAMREEELINKARGRAMSPTTYTNQLQSLQSLTPGSNGVHDVTADQSNAVVLNSTVVSANNDLQSTPATDEKNAYTMQ